MPSIFEAKVSGVATFTGEPLENGNQFTAFIDFDKDPPALLGCLVKSNQMPMSPWWADEDLQKHIGGAWTSVNDDIAQAVAEVRKNLNRESSS